MSMMLLFLSIMEFPNLDLPKNIERPKLLQKTKYSVNLQKAEANFMDYDTMIDDLDVDGRVATHLTYENPLFP